MRAWPQMDTAVVQSTAMGVAAAVVGVRQEQYAGFAAIASRSNGSGWSSCRLIQGMIPERLWPEREKRGLILSDGSDSSGSGRDMSSCVWSGFGMSGYVGVAVPGDGSDSVLRLEIYWL